ncbi:uncharacterized protein LOC134187529 [Corticium candelabrum]|uniref:uncharacterized protein LOC134187529 n=1 Tax=Corticium candelabrum TaxID=121492 RepID=UPI002E256A85|nr:uncharacterized protein LOC134187529 [Corticium candelabrum]
MAELVRESGRVQVLGVALVSELRFLPSSSHKKEQPSWSEDYVLGVVLGDPETLTIRELREMLSEQLETVPSSFRFLTKQGWPVSSRQEPLIKAVHVVDDKNVVRIERMFAQSRVGVLTESGGSVGFLFIDLTATVMQLREAMKKQISYVAKFSDGLVILDRNGWPISQDQESKLTVVDVLIGQTMYIRDSNVTKSNWLPVIVNPHAHSGHQISTMGRGHPSLAEVKSPRLALTDVTDGGDPVLIKDMDAGKEVLISYVRKEAAKYARDLKCGLLELGLSVYLDVHEIKCGVDWQDSLNNGIAGCEVFVPLVTPSYGETQWTNREVKLADVLGKFIVPVNFVSDWPPRCLAIQFATTQFIPWKLAENATAGDPHTWDHESIFRVSKAIAEKLARERGSGLTEREITLKSYASVKDLPPLVAAKTTSLKESRDGKPLIVVCCHVEQLPFVSRLQAILSSCSYDVWSTDKLSLHEQEQLLNEQQKSGAQQKYQHSVSFSDGDGKKFTQRVDEANCIVLVLSTAFAKSVTCQQQVFYCEHRKRLVKIQFEKFAVPPWLSMLIGTRAMVDGQTSDFEKVLKHQVELALDPFIEPDADDSTDEALLSRYIKVLKSMLPDDNMVYISGGVDFYNSKSEAVCRAIGTALAQNEHLSIVTGGFYGVGETVGRSFFAERKRLHRSCGVYHVLPVKESKDFSGKAVQNADGLFAKLSYGETIFCGQSVRQREMIVSRIITISIIVEGGPGAAHEAEEFAWNDHTVIPVQVTGGAAGGNFGVPTSIFQTPPGVSESDWSQLSNEDASPEEIGMAIERIVQTILTAEVTINEQVQSASSPASTASITSTQDV